MRLTLTTPPASMPIDLASAKKHCRVDHGDDDTLIEGLIEGVVSYLDGPSGILGRAIMPQTWLLELESWPGEFSIPVEPVRAVTVTYVDDDGATQTLDAASYDLEQWPSFAATWSFAADVDRPVLGDVRYPVKFSIEAGFASADDVESGLKTLMLMLVAHWYENREAVVVGTSTGELPLAASTLLAKYRRML